MKNKQPTRGNGFLEKFLAKIRSETADRLIPDNLRNGAILDIGCGNYPYFLDNIVFSRKFGADKLTAGMDGKKITFNNINIENESLPYQNEMFDAIVMLASIEHIERKKLPGLFQEINRVLKKNGVFVITAPTSSGNKILKLMAALNIVSPEEIKEHTGGFAKKDILNYLKISGFSYEEFKNGLFEFGFNNWFLIKK
jgi:SAM-dependent methyltransferase